MRISVRELKRVIREEVGRGGAGAVDRLKALADKLGLRFEAPYEWGYDEETGDEVETGAVKFDAAIIDSYQGWSVGLEHGGNVILHTIDDDVAMTLDQIESLLLNHDLDDVLEMSTDEISGLIGL